MVHRIVWRVGSDDALDFWRERLEGARRSVARTEATPARAPEAAAGGLRFADPEGLGHELVVDRSGNAALSGTHDEIPAALALLGFDGLRAFSAEAARSSAVLKEALGFEPAGGDSWEVRGETRGAYTPATSLRRSGGCRGSGRCTTLRSPSPRRTTTPGSSGSPMPGSGRRRSSTVTT